ncbi:MAG TPA: DHA2 family efflux MFS transporter permease subunit [Steroidobacteraceae bacterium]|jgi:DHA2 family multidrug resistance protein|nr:DHA2 family efflux MFS transporter permease subunit [Steroidobacteraceae bacterium]
MARNATLIALAMATFMQVLDTTIANVSIPTIAGNLGVSSDQGTWIITSFAVANGVSVPLTGWLTRRFGIVKTFSLSVLLFTIASFLCGLSQSITELLVFRVLQGAVSGPMIPGSQALLLTLFPESKKGTALAIWSATTLVAPICGPILGGYISDNYAWGWIFLINVPVGLICALVCWQFLKSRETPAHVLKMDWMGLVLLIVWVGSLQVMLDQGKDLDWFNSTTIVTLCAVCIVSLAAWIIWELTDRAPIVDLTLFKSRSFTLGTLALCLVFGIFFGNLVLMPLWLQNNVNYTATWAGIATAPSGVTALIVAPIVGRLISRYDARWFATISFVVFAASYFMRAAYPPDASFWVIAMPALVQGVAMGIFLVALFTIALDRLPPERIPAASGLNNFLRITATGFATSLFTTYWDRRERFHQSRLVESLSVFNPRLRQVEAALRHLGLSSHSAAAAVLHEVVNQGFLLSSLDLFYFSGWATLVLIGACWLVRRPAGGAVAAGGE